MGAFFRVVISEGVRDRESTFAGGAMKWCLEDGVKKEGLVLFYASVPFAIEIPCKSKSIQILKKFYDNVTVRYSLYFIVMDS